LSWPLIFLALSEGLSALRAAGAGLDFSSSSRDAFFVFSGLAGTGFSFEEALAGRTIPLPLSTVDAGARGGPDVKWLKVP
jgi:hypothetical protein